jgi:type VI protein secretion system component Hcp
MAFTTILTLESYSTSDGSRVLPVEAFNFDVEQTLNIGSQSSGAGAGKITFNPFSITRFPDNLSPALFVDCASGTAFKTATLTVTPDGAGVPFITYLMKLVAVKTISVGGNQHGGPLPIETVTFEYGGLLVISGDPSMNNVTIGGWNRVKNVADSNPNSVIK